MDKEFKEQLEKIKWPIDYGSIKIQVKDGKPTFAVIESVIKLS